MQKKRLAFGSLVAIALLAITGCGGGNGGDSEPEIKPSDLKYKDGTVLRIGAGYNNNKTGISFKNPDVVGTGLTLSNGKTYHTNDLKPTWAYLQDSLKITFQDVYQGNSTQNEWKYWENKLGDVDVVAGTTALLNAAGAQGKVVDISQYLDHMPAFKYYLEQNPIVRLSITGAKTNNKLGAIYFSPYFDGVNDIERMPLMRADMVRKLLDDSNFAGANRPIDTKVYTPYMPSGGTVSVDSLSSDGKSVITITKDYSKYGNIVKKMNDKQGLTGNEALAMFKEYIQKTYNGHYTKLSDLFLGYDAAWDADEMVALFRIAHAQLNDTDGNAVVPLFSRETAKMSRNVDLFRFAGHLFGVRGLESRSDFLYFDNNGQLQDARTDVKAYNAVERINALVQEGLVVTEGSGASKNFLTKDAGLMSYDYNQTQTIMNDTITYTVEGQTKTFAETGREYVAVMVPVAKWNDGEEKYMRFTESWRSVKTDGWAISAEGVKNNPDKLNAALTLIDYAFSIQGQITMSYGPDEFIKVKEGWDKTKTITKWSQVSEKYETFNFNGQAMPVISDGCRGDLFEKAQGNYTNFARMYLGSTLNGFPKSQAFEYQCTSLTGQKGSAVLSAAISKGVIKHPFLAVNTENMWYTSVPTTLPVTAQQQALLDSYVDLVNNFKSSDNTHNVFVYLIKGGYEHAYQGESAIGNQTTAEGLANYVAVNWSGTAYIGIKNAQWNSLLNFYKTL